MASSEAHKKASVKWQKENMRRVSFDLYPEQAATLKAYAAERGETVGGLLKRLIRAELQQAAAAAGHDIPAAWSGEPRQGTKGAEPASGGS